MQGERGEEGKGNYWGSFFVVIRKRIKQKKKTMAVRFCMKGKRQWTEARVFAAPPSCRQWCGGDGG